MFAEIDLVFALISSVSTSTACSTAKLPTCNEIMPIGFNFNTANDIYGPFSAERSWNALHAIPNANDSIDGT